MEGSSNTKNTQIISDQSITSQVSTNVNRNFDPFIMENKNYNYLMDRNTVDQDSIRSFKNMIDKSKKNRKM
jgi:hypothetical protein